jgi:large conductance mechanosensitive channel
VLKEFKEFAMRGNMLDLAVGVIIGAAFGGVVSSLVSDVIMPPLGRLIGHEDFSNLYINLSETQFATHAEAKAHGMALSYGSFINTIINFLIVAFAVFLLVRAVNKFFPKPAPPVTTKECPQCAMAIPIQAKKCGHCTSAV